MSAVLGARARSRAAPRASLLWYERGFVLAVLVAAVVTVDPLRLHLAERTVLKHVPLALALLFFTLGAAANRLRAPAAARAQDTGVLRTAWPLLALAMLIIGGSLYERLIVGVHDTFLNVGLYMLMVFVAASVVSRSAAPVALLRAYFAVLLGAGLVMGALLIKNYHVRQVYHEQIFIVIPLAVLCLAAQRRSALNWLGGAFFLAMTWFSQKYTSYAVGTVTAVYLLAAIALPRLAARPALGRALVVYWAVVLGLACLALGAAVLLTHHSELPTGNPGYRLHTYRAALERFAGSPLWGTLYAAEAVHRFTLFSIGVAGNDLPTHSDVLDLLANGGLLGIGLWALGLARIARASARHPLARRTLGAPEAPYAHALAMISIAAIITYTVNPILLQPPKAFFVWTSLGLLLGVALRQRAPSGVHNTQYPNRS